MNQNRGHLRVLAPALGAWALTIVAFLTSETVVTALAVAAALSALAALLIRRTKPEPKAIATALMLCAAVTAAITARMDFPQHLPAALAGEQSVPATVIDYPATGWVDLRLEPGGEARVWLRDPLPSSVAPGSAVTVSGKFVAEPRLSQHHYTVDQTTVTVDENPPQPLQKLFQLLRDLRVNFREAAAAHPWGQLVPGFAYGDTELVTPELEAAMLESSLTHLTAVSGSNCALVVAAVAFVVPWRKLRLVCSVCALVLFVFLIGPDSSVLRAALMAWAVLIGRFGGRRGNGFHALGIAMLVLLWIWPNQAIAPGFALSVLATLGILTLGNSITTFLTARRFPLVLALPTALTLAAQVFVMPVLLLLQPGIPIAGVPANILAAPFAPIGTGFGLVATVALPVAPVIAEAALHIAATATKAVEVIAYWASELPLARVNWPAGVGGAALLGATQILFALAWALRSGKILHTRFPTRQRLWEAKPEGMIRAALPLLLAGAAVSVIAITAVLRPALYRFGVPHDWEIAACDVGQGDALLVRDHRDPRSTVLIDTGDDREKLRACLQLLGVTHLAAVILTHDDKDHVGAVAELADYDAVALISEGIEADTAQPGGARPLLGELEKIHMPSQVVTAGQSFQIQRGEVLPLRDSETPPRGVASAGVRVEVLAPQAGRQFTDRNSASLVTRISTPHLTGLFLGDTGKQEHRRLKWQTPPAQLEVDVVKAAHHGSGDADHTLPAVTRAQFSLVSVGADNSYGHPAAEAIRSWRQHGTAVLRTDLLGTVTINAQHEVWASDPHPPSKMSRYGNWRD